MIDRENGSQPWKERSMSTSRSSPRHNGLCTITPWSESSPYHQNQSRILDMAMPQAFDPYHQWLGIPPGEQPPHHYRLLGIASFEDNPKIIESAADRQMAHLRTF